MKLFLVLGWGLMAAVAAIPAAAAPFGSGANFRPFMQDQRSWSGPQREAARPGPRRQAARSGPQREVARPGPQREADRPGPQREVARPGPQREADRFGPQRETRAPGEADRGRMSPDERRQLRRDIQDAGRDLYYRDRPAPRREQRR